MKINFKKYDNRTFSEDVEVDKKIKALFLLFDYEVMRNQLSYTKQVKLIDSWIKSFEDYETYEVIPMFKIRRDVILKQSKIEEYDNMSVKERLALMLTNFKLKRKNLFKRLFNKKN
jgi:hypothetical protein